MQPSNPSARYNNPGNLRGSQDWEGQIGVSKGGFAIFRSFADGDRAYGKNLLNQQKLHGINTISGLIAKYAPPSENNTVAYISEVAKMTGFGTDQALDFSSPQVQNQLKRAMYTIEGVSNQAARQLASDFKTPEAPELALGTQQ